MAAVVRTLLAGAWLVSSAAGLRDSTALVQETVQRSLRQDPEVLKRAEEVLEVTGPLQLRQKPTVKDKESLMTAQALLRKPALLKLFTKKPAKEEAKAADEEAAPAIEISASSPSEPEAVELSASSSSTRSSATARKRKAASTSNHTSARSSAHHAVKHSAVATSATVKHSSKRSTAAHKATSSSNRTTGNSSAHRASGTASVHRASGNSSAHRVSGNSTMHRAAGNSSVHRVAGNSSSRHAGNHSGNHSVKHSTVRRKVRRTFNCTKGDEAAMQELGGGTAKGSFPELTASCGKKAFSLTKGLDENAFLGCFATKMAKITQPCGKCFAGAAHYGVKTCALQCMGSWCSQKCLECAQKYREGPLKDCVGFPTPEASACK